MTEEIPDFSEEISETIKFKINGTTFEAFRTIPAATMIESMRLDDFIEIADMVDVEDSTKITGKQQLQVAQANLKTMQRYAAFIDQCLLPESAKQFAEGLRSKEKPITLRQMGKVYRLLMEKYGDRPTEPSSPSSNGHDGTGPLSTAGVPTEASTPSLFPPPASGT